MELKDISTKELTDELLKREGIKYTRIDLESKCAIYKNNCIIEIEGPAIIIVNKD